MARLSENGLLRPLWRDSAGAVYVEFLIAIVPVVTLFLAICQFALIGAAELIVQHAAQRAVRTAIVTLEEEPSHFGGVARGVLSEGRAETDATGTLLTRLMGGEIANRLEAPVAFELEERPQQGARLESVRASAYVPLLTLSPNTRPRGARHSLGGALSDPLPPRLSRALDYTRAAAAVTVMAGPDAESLAGEPVARDANVTVRVTYLFSCGVPLISALLCDTEASVALDSDTRDGASRARLLELRESAAGLAGLGLEDARVYVISAQATLPNQGATYTKHEGSS